MVWFLGFSFCYLTEDKKTLDREKIKTHFALLSASLRLAILKIKRESIQTRPDFLIGSCPLTSSEPVSFCKAVINERNLYERR